MIKIFVTGGIGSGKSTLISFLEAHGAATVQADLVGHQNLFKPEVKGALVTAFGADILDESGEVNRATLAAKAFSSAENTRLLDSITLPFVYSESLAALEELGKTHKVVVLEMAILDGRDNFGDNADLIIAVTTSEEVRIKRLMEYRGFSEEDARNRLANQVSEERRLAIADVVFTDDGTVEEFETQIDSWWESFKKEYHL